MSKLIEKKIECEHCGQMNRVSREECRGCGGPVGNLPEVFTPKTYRTSPEVLPVYAALTTAANLTYNTTSGWLIK